MAARIVLSALKWARLRGATEAWLQVEAANEAAAGLYESIGFAKSTATTIAARREPDRDRPAARRILLVAACALIDADGRVLIAQRPPGKTLAGLWEFPGGKVEPGETPEEALIRELREEIGIETKAACLAPLTFASHCYDTFPPPDAALRLPPLHRHSRAARGAGAEMGAAEGTARLSRCRRPTCR